MTEFLTTVAFFYWGNSENLTAKWGKGKVLKPGGKISFSASRKLDAEGSWRFWPAYQTAGHWGPFRWHEIEIQVDGGDGGNK
jgi:hypothetical protein